MEEPLIIDVVAYRRLLSGVQVGYGLEYRITKLLRDEIGTVYLPLLS